MLHGRCSERRQHALPGGMEGSEGDGIPPPHNVHARARRRGQFARRGMEADWRTRGWILVKVFQT